MAQSAGLISSEELARRLGAPALRIFDCTTYLKPRPEGGYNVESGRANYDKGHIPGAAFLDLGGDLSDQGSRLRFTLPPLDRLTGAFGFDDAAVLDGGLDKWKAENRPLSTEATTYRPATLSLRGRPEIFVGKDEIKAAIGKPGT